MATMPEGPEGQFRRECTEAGGDTRQHTTQPGAGRRLDGVMTGSTIHGRVAADEKLAASHASDRSFNRAFTEFGYELTKQSAPM